MCGGVGVMRYVCVSVCDVWCECVCIYGMCYVWACGVCVYVDGIC